MPAIPASDWFAARVQVGGVMYVESGANWTRTQDEMMGFDLTDINPSDYLTMQMAMEGMVRAAPNKTN
eukprot:5306633-Pyramimonas_sp.AAC.1